GWEDYDFLCITGDAYVDHPSFGFAIITRVLENAGYRCAVLAQPDFKDLRAFKALGRPRLGALITGGNIDSMVAHYTVGKKRRTVDDYSPGGKMGIRPDRATIVYANCVRAAFPDLFISIGGLEASLRRFAHYDYWDDAVRRSILVDSKADILVYGMAENTMVALADCLRDGGDMHALRGVAYIGNDMGDCSFPYVIAPSFEDACINKKLYAKAARIEQNEQDAVTGRAIIQPQGSAFLVCTPPPLPLTTEEFDTAYGLHYMRGYHPSYDKLGGVKAILEVQNSIIHNRGCFGGCNFCSLAFHQGRRISVRSHESVLREAIEITKSPDFKGYINDVGGPTANFRAQSCSGQEARGMCKRNCLSPEPCPNLVCDHSDYLELLRKLRALPRVKRVFIRSGIRYDYLMKEKNGEFFRELCEYHVSGQLKVAPEHCVDSVLDYMGKPHFDVYRRFADRFKSVNRKLSREQYLVPYLISSHPGCTLRDAVQLTEYLNSIGHMPEQVQDFYPTPGTVSTCMYYTGIDPRTMKEVYVPKDAHEKAMQRALLQWRKPDKRRLVLEALKLAGREDLIGNGKGCLVRAENRMSGGDRRAGAGNRPGLRDSGIRSGSKNKKRR
ncbi:MAG: YgiQ family radical SAM protein, partial [Clostridia bacterium]